MKTHTVRPLLFALTASIVTAGAQVAYLDADPTSNTTLADGTPMVNGTHYTSANAADGLWAIRGFGNAGGVFTSNDAGGEDAPRVRTTIAGLTVGETYEVYAYFWGAEAGARWRGRVSLADEAGNLPGYNTNHFSGSSFSPMSYLTSESNVSGENPGPLSTADGSGVENGGYFTSGTVLTEEGDRRLYEVSLGTAVADGTGSIAVYIDDLANTASADRTWYDGVGFKEIAATTNTVTISPSPVNGSINLNPAGGVYATGSSVVAEAVPDAGYILDAWGGDLNATLDNPAALIVDADKTISVTFTADLSDNDGDGLTAFDEATIHGTDPDLADTDFDGFSDSEELNASPPSDPTSIGSVPFGPVVYVDAAPNTTGLDGNTTLADGTLLADGTSGFVGTANVADGFWSIDAALTSDGSNGTIWETSGDEDAPRLKVTLTGLTPCQRYYAFAYFWGADGQTYRARAGLQNLPGDLQGFNTAHFAASTFSNTPYVTRAITNNTINPGPLSSDDGSDFAFENGGYFDSTNSSPTSINTVSVGGTYTLYQVNLGGAFADANGDLCIYIDDLANNTPGNATLFDGVGYVEDGDYTAGPPRTLTINQGSNGTIAADKSGYCDGETAIITATPELGYVFDGWSGSLSGTASPESLTFNGGDEVVGGTFSIDGSDNDGDGLSAFDELTIHSTDPDCFDSDGDGYDDFTEVNGSTSPVDANDFPGAGEQVVYVDASLANLTLADGSPLVDGVDYNAGGSAWDIRVDFGNDDSVWAAQGFKPRLRMNLTGLKPNTTGNLYAYFWGIDGLALIARTGLSDVAGKLQLYSTSHPATIAGEVACPMLSLDVLGDPGGSNQTISPGITIVDNGNTTGGGQTIFESDPAGANPYFTTAVDINQRGDIRLHQIGLGEITTDGSGNASFFVEATDANGNNRVWFDGAGVSASLVPVSSAITITGVSYAGPGNDMIITFTGSPNTSYNVESSDDASASTAFTTVAGVTALTNGSGEGVMTIPSLNIANGEDYFRIAE